MGESGDNEASYRTKNKHQIAPATVKKRWARSIPVKDIVQFLDSLYNQLTSVNDHFNFAKHVMFLKLESWKKACIFKEVSIFEGVLEVEDLEESLDLQRSFNLRSFGKKFVSSKKLQSLRVFLKLKFWKKVCIFKGASILKLESWKKVCIFKEASIFEGVLEVGVLEESLYLQRSFNLRWSEFQSSRLVDFRS
ncbi:pentatricopeptide repeat-containing protein [Cucumis melo var. makuwa]|uniref:Pentatricopeptide repeat-containing protein n=1 Tax=Cucumis melo var. makuwa TaxID=1194695 RepID=A0A5A7TBY5_CUCMM|nr:pentatricopeptide repeat-containing protein [Cucumis melo var. makuwa]